MSKYCIFCGNKPQEKSREHIIPQWLIELTGDPKREAFFGYHKPGTKGEGVRKYPFKHFTFPACVTCNTNYGRLEAEVKPVVEKILDESAISSEDMSMFLEWIDKVRIGLWLGMQQLDKNYLDVDVNFHIDKRIGQYDRLLIIQKTDRISPRINFGATDTPAFSYTPSVFTFSINNYNFISISSAFLFSRRIGFPYLKEMILSPDSDEFGGELINGIKRVMKPLIRRAIPNNGVIVYQPQFRNGMIRTEDELSEYDCDYVRTHALDYQKGNGNIFCEKNGVLNEYGSNDEINELQGLPVNDDYQLSIKSIIEAHKWQNWLHSQLPDMKLLTLEQKKFVKSRFALATKVNNLWINRLEEML
ncbi:hypothetical protein LA983_004012 [Vibrio fluvialis]|uniref:hypothetical protein n=1 Tax=Vibrio fluvialis TaxID=676 RepID=UPI001EEC7EF4|nr:hypothetical protein [Vibrio fluvialis]EKO3519532.1 hypothetical protein [Vibrio fluvialis]MCG6398876.1 hypothetical protein [Vibrio fluvialis]